MFSFIAGQGCALAGASGGESAVKETGKPVRGVAQQKLSETDITLFEEFRDGLDGDRAGVNAALACDAPDDSLVKPVHRVERALQPLSPDR